MAETIYSGYVITKQPYQTFDEVVTFLKNDGQKISCLSRGSRKIESKNARHLFLGSYVEFEIFQSRHEDKLSRLKKVTTIENIDWNFETLESFNLLNECISKLNVRNKKEFDFYKKHLEMIKTNVFYEKILILIILEQFIKLSGNTIEVNHCVKCHSHKLKTISFKDHGMLCNLCFDNKRNEHYELTISKTIYYLFNGEYEKLNQFIQELNFVIKLLRIYVDDNAGINLISLKNY